MEYASYAIAIVIGLTLGWFIPELIARGILAINHALKMRRIKRGWMRVDTSV